MGAASGRTKVTANRTTRAGRVAAIGLVAVALVLAGCGRKGNLELPPDASIKDQPKAMPAGKAPAKVPEKSFVLDGLL